MSALPPKGEVDQSISGTPSGCWPLNSARDVIQGPKLEPRIMRYELSDYEWTAINVNRRPKLALTHF
jgi:hypothetical protein